MCHISTPWVIPADDEIQRLQRRLAELERQAERDRLQRRIQELERQVGWGRPWIPAQPLMPWIPMAPRPAQIPPLNADDIVKLVERQAKKR